MRISKAEAARQMGMSRTTLYKLIETGKLSVHPDGSIDPAELVRAVSTLSGAAVHRGRSRGVHRGQVEVDVGTQRHEQNGRPRLDDAERAGPLASERQLTSTYQDLVDILREQLQMALAREKDYQARITWLEHQVDYTQQRYDRLLEAPRPLPVSVPLPASPQHPPARLPDTWQPLLHDLQQPHPPHHPPQDESALHPSAVVPPAAPRGAMRQRILALLRAHPEGLTTTELRGMLRVEKSLSDTCSAMLRDGLIRRGRPGRYVVAEDA